MILFSQLCSLAIAVRQIFGQFKGLLHPLETFFSSSNPIIVHDYSILTRALQYDYLTLEFVSKRLSSEAKHFRKRIGYIVPGVDKVGAIPSALAGILSVLRLTGNKELPLPSWFQLPSGSLVGIIAGIGVLYASGLILTLASQRMDTLAQLIALAAERKDMGDRKSVPSTEFSSDETSEGKESDEPEDQNGNDGAIASDGVAG